ncbi:MAG: molecular chaperone GroEL [Flavobacteriales bacterium TMED191]|nr:MAG: molecular chaperone GroEL [Flavobacteriales bacterium TMED191]
MTTQLSHGPELRNKVLDGVNTLADYVATTLGPKGQNVLIHQKDKRPFVTKDGVTVAQNVNFEDPHMNAGAEVVKQVSAMTNAEAGDGTTTSTVLAREILNQANKYITSGTSPIEIKRGLEQCLQDSFEVISELSKPISSAEDVKHIATISANNDETIGNLVATAVDKVGKNGSITIEEARSLDTSLDLVEGFRFDSGYAATAFITDNRRATCRYENPMFMITDTKIDQVNQILPALEIAARENRPFVIVAEEVEGQALAALIMNTMRGSMKVAAVKAPRYGEERRAIMSDLAVSTGAKFFQQSLGHQVTDVSLTDFGKAASVEITKNTTTVVDGEGDYEKVDQTIESIKAEIQQTDDIHEAGRLQDRVTRLSSGVAIIRVGASSEVEMIEKKHRIEDALEAVRSAQQEGIVPGGGMTLLRISESIAPNFPTEEQATAFPIFKRALESPFRTMASNAGLSPEVTMLMIEGSTGFEGVNFSTGNREDLKSAGILDPAKVTRCALKNAVSVAGTLLLTNHSIVHN